MCVCGGACGDTLVCGGVSGAHVSGEVRAYVSMGCVCLGVRTSAGVCLGHACLEVCLAGHVSMRRHALWGVCLGCKCLWACMSLGGHMWGWRGVCVGGMSGGVCIWGGVCGEGVCVCLGVCRGA